MAQISFSREKTQILKGIALLLMLVHHTTLPNHWAEEGTSLFTYLEHQVSATKMCVYIFAFLVGYGFFCSKNKTIHYSFKRILLLVVPFWAMMLCMFLPAAYLSGGLSEIIVSQNSTWGGYLDLFYNLFGISESLNWYSWFVCFYILVILSMPYLHKLYDRFPKYGWIASIFAYYVAECAIHMIPGWSSNPILQNLFTYTMDIPLVIVGYQCAKWNSQGKIPSWFEGRNRIVLAIVTIVAVLLFNSLHLPLAGFCLKAFYTPFLIFAVVGIFNSFELKWLSKGLTKVGDHSMYMWFFHAIFFTETVNLYTKNLVFEPIHNYFYTFFMTFVLTYCGSWVIKKLLTPIINTIK